jgi:mannose-6-phosphate isomerase-like protein (cupin superfamily)
MQNKLVFNAQQVVGFSPRGYEHDFESRMLVDAESVGSQRLVMNYFVLKPGKSTDPGDHPTPFDEIYYVLRGQGVVYLGPEHEPFDLIPDSVVFIPSGTTHALTNTGSDDLEMITVMPGPLAAGANTLYDERKATWGTSFRLHD